MTTPSGGSRLRVLHPEPSARTTSRRALGKLARHHAAPSAIRPPAQAKLLSPRPFKRRNHLRTNASKWEFPAIGSGCLVSLCGRRGRYARPAKTTARRRKDSDRHAPCPRGRRPFAASICMSGSCPEPYARSYQPHAHADGPRRSFSDRTARGRCVPRSGTRPPVPSRRQYARRQRQPEQFAPGSRSPKTAAGPSRSAAHRPGPQRGQAADFRPGLRHAVKAQSDWLRRSEPPRK